VIGGGTDWGYDADSLIALDAKIDDNLVLYNFHPYMGPNQAGLTTKNADGYEAMVK